jgi:SAM-dependent methyltransferase
VDLGCGYGRLSECYLNRFNQTILVDSSISLLRQAQETTNGRGWFLAGDINHLPFKQGSFDTVLMVRVFHHLPDSQKCLSEVGRIASRGGSFIFSYSNKRNLARIAGYLLGRDPNNPFSIETHGLDTTLIRHHPRYVSNLLVQTGFTNLQFRGAGVVDKITKSQGPYHIWLTLGKFLAPFFGKTKLSPWVFCKGIVPGKTKLIETETIIDLLQCPLCGSNLIDERNLFLCSGCKEKYPVSDGIIDFRPK